MTILNLTQHIATPEQVEVGVIEPTDKERVKNLLTFVGLPTKELISERAQALADITSESGCESAMIGGAPYLLGALENALKKRGVKPLYSFTERVSVEKQKEDGIVEKVAIFKHAGWVEV